MNLLIQVAIGAVVGIIIGLVFGQQAGYLKPIDDIFIRFLQMLSVPLTYLVLIDGTFAGQCSTMVKTVVHVHAFTFIETFTKIAKSL